MSKTAIITGGSRGIGFEIALKLGRGGYNIVIFTISKEEDYSNNLRELEENNIDYSYVQGDISKSIDRQGCLEIALNKYGSVEALINNAGVGPKIRSDLLNMTEDSYDFVMSINLKGTLFLTQLIANQMIKQEAISGLKGIIVNISSMSAYVSSVTRGEYCISKAGVSMMTKLFADRLAAEGIMVFEVRPGIIATDMTSAVKDKYDLLIDQGLYPIKRWGTPQDVANVVYLFCSGNLAYSTGEVINVDGGYHIPRL